MIIEAIRKINPDAVVTVRGDDINTCEIEWLDGTTPISKEDIQAKQTELQAEYDSLDYARKRKTEYPTIEDCVHAILDDDLENLQILRQVVKEKFPKENS